MALDYDVIVVGAGPAGAMAAGLLGQAGRRVLVLERQKLPRYKACGGGVPINVFDSLPAACWQAIERRVTRVRFLLPGEGEVAHDLPGRPVAMVMRDRFDASLLAQAPATVHDGEGVVAVEEGPSGAVVRTATGGRYQAAYVVGADGAYSIVARAAGLRTGHAVGVALEAEVPVAGGLLESYADTALFLLGTVRYGYVWVFPKGDHLSLGIGTFREGSGGALRQLLLAAAGHLGLPVEAVRPRGHALPAYRQREPLQRGHVLLVGDAAGLMDPLSGEGIRHALYSGRLAAQAILNGDVAGYSARAYQEIGRDLQMGRRLAWLFYSFPRLCFRLGARDRAIVGGLTRMLGGEIGYRELMLRVPGYLLGRLRPW